MATYGNFPGVKVSTSQGGISSVGVGRSEKLVIFGEGKYDSMYNVDGDASAGEPRQINAPLEADTLFGADSELADAMKEALQNGANIDFLYGVAVPQEQVTAESHEKQEGELDNKDIVENTDTITVRDMDGSGNETSTLNVEFRYTPEYPEEVSGGLETPDETDTIFINPLSGDYAASSQPTNNFEFDYLNNDYETAFGNSNVMSVVNENETGVFWALSDSDATSSQLNGVVQTLRSNYQLVTGFAFGEPNGERVFDATQTSSENGGSEPRYNSASYTNANQSVSSNSFFKVAPARVSGDPTKTIGGGLAGVYVGNPIDDAVYNESVSGYSSLQQQLNKTEADELRDQDLIPVRSGGSVRVKGNRATNFSDNQTVASDFFTRRIADRVILVVKQIGDAILGRINNPETRGQAESQIQNQLGSLAADGIIKSNAGDEKNYNVEVFEDSTERDKVNINVQFTPFGIVKKVDASVTVNV